MLHKGIAIAQQMAIGLCKKKFSAD